MNNKRTHTNYQDFLLESLKDPLEVEAYLRAAIADEDRNVFFLALKDSLDARGKTIAELSIETGLNRQNLYRMLSLEGNPQFNSIKKVLKSIGFELDIKPIKTKESDEPK